MEFLIIPIIMAIIFVIIIAILLRNINFPNIITESGSRRAGRHGEATATEEIKSVMRDGDLLFTNVEISYDNRPAELDNVIVNTFGVFIIEVKNYKGRLYGNEEDYEWEKYKDDDYGNTFKKSVKNPIRQVNRQAGILARYLDYYGAHVWVEGYALLVQGNSPVESKSVLLSTYDIDRAIHTCGRNRLTKQQVETIANILC